MPAAQAERSAPGGGKDKKEKEKDKDKDKIPVAVRRAAAASWARCVAAFCRERGSSTGSTVSLPAHADGGWNHVLPIGAWQSSCLQRAFALQSSALRRYCGPLSTVS